MKVQSASHTEILTLPWPLTVVGYFSVSTGATQSLRFRRGEEQVTLDSVHHDVLVSDSSAQLAAALAGLGLVQTLDFIVRPAIEHCELVPVLGR